MKTDRFDLAAHLLAACALIAVMMLHLLPALLCGLLVYQLVHLLAPHLARRLATTRGKLLAVLVLATCVTGLLTAAILGLAAFLRSDTGGLPMLFQKMAEILDDARKFVPADTAINWPADADELRTRLSHWLREHGPQVQLAGQELVRGLAHILIGLILGAIISLREALPGHTHKPLAHAMIGRLTALADAFSRVVFAQVRISAINTVFTAIYLAVVLPAFDVHLPMVPTLIAVTFIAGLLPVIGNLISNTITVVVSLAHSLPAAIASLVFLVVIHKFEYFLNARIIGTQVKSTTWELLLAMLVMEATFGLPGVVAAPIYYAYLKAEWVARGWV